jgi:O-antigen/teichoic acid export membrane protein
MERYRAMSTSRVVGVVVAMFVSLAGAYTLPGAWGLLVGYVTGQAATLAVLAKSALKEDGVAVRTFDAAHLRSLASRHRRFAAYSTPTEFINVFLAQAPILLLTGFVGPAAVGLFNMTNRLLGLPNTFIAGAVSEVFQQRASSDYAEHGTCRPLYLKTAKTLSALGILPTLILAIGAPMLFELYLGNKWRGAGDYARILAVLNLLRLVVSPLSYVFYIAERQREDMVAHCFMVIAIVGAMYLTHIAGGEHLAIIGAYAIVYSLVYVYYGLRGYQLAVKPLA